VLVVGRGWGFRDAVVELCADCLALFFLFLSLLPILLSLSASPVHLPLPSPHYLFFPLLQSHRNSMTRLSTTFAFRLSTRSAQGHQVRKEGRSRSLPWSQACGYQEEPSFREEAQELRYRCVVSLPFFAYSPQTDLSLPSSGQAIKPTTDLTRFVKWPEYVRLQRQKVILNQRLKCPPAIAQFSQVLDKNTATQLFRLLNKYKGETKQEKKVRLEAKAADLAGGKKSDESKKPFFVKSGLNVRLALSLLRPLAANVSSPYSTLSVSLSRRRPTSSSSPTMSTPSSSSSSFPLFAARWVSPSSSSRARLVWVPSSVARPRPA
jgi:hypothetical protein